MNGSTLCKTIANDCFSALPPHSEARIAALLTFKAIALRMFHVCVKNAIESILSVSERIAVNKVMIQEKSRKDKLRACCVCFLTV